MELRRNKYVSFFVAWKMRAYPQASHRSHRVETKLRRIGHKQKYLINRLDKMSLQTEWIELVENRISFTEDGE